MKLSNKQALLLYEIAKDTVRIMGVMGGMSQKDRKFLVEQIRNQQSDKVVELDDE